MRVININAYAVLDSTQVLPEELLDEYGFILESQIVKYNRTISEIRRRHNKHYLGKIGSARCRGLCVTLPHESPYNWRKFQPDHRYQKYESYLYYCSMCECMMRCVRCRCCNRLGRRKMTNAKPID